MTHRTRDHREVEVKFELDGRSAREVRRHALLSKAEHHTDSQRSIYFDTDESDVHRAGYSLRVRQIGECFTQTVKTNEGSAGLFDRKEWEARVQRLAPDPEALRQTPLGKLKKFGRKAKPRVCSEVERTTWVIDRDSSIVEVALDSGSVSSGEQEAPFHELELELKDGEPTALFDFARELGQAVPLQIGVLSKEERGLMLAAGAFGHEHKAPPVDISKKMDAGQAFALIVHECIRHFRLNEPLIIQQRNPDALHQARVAMRRLRTAFTLFRPAIQQGSLEPLSEELRQFIDPFGDPRNLDVFLDEHEDELGSGDRRKLKSARVRAYDQVIDRLKMQRSRDMLLDLIEWTDSGGWRKRAASTPIRKFASRRLEGAWRKVRRKGKGIGDLDEQHLHRLRISIKKLRYAVDFLTPLYARKRVRRFVSSLEEMQDCLGLVHDGMVCRQIVSDFGLDETGGTNGAGRSRQLKRIATRFKHLKRVKRFWKS